MYFAEDDVFAEVALQQVCIVFMRRRMEAKTLDSDEKQEKKD